jgi:hypothetical protein
MSIPSTIGKFLFAYNTQNVQPFIAAVELFMAILPFYVAGG